MSYRSNIFRGVMLAGYLTLVGSTPVAQYAFNHGLNGKKSVELNLALCVAGLATCYEGNRRLIMDENRKKQKS